MKMTGKICDNVEYINKIKDNFFKIKQKELEKAYNILKKADCTVVYGAGRSLFASLTGMGQLAKDRRIICPDNFGFPGIDWLSKKYKNTVLLIVSGGGGKGDPLNTAMEVKEHIGAGKLRGVKIVAITANPDSRLGEIAKEYGRVIELKGRTKESGSLRGSKEFFEEGIMGDQFELGALSLCQRIAECMHNNEPAGEIFKRAEKQFPIIGKRVDEMVCSEDYKTLIDKMMQPHSVTLGGVANGGMVASMAAIRFMHVKRVLGDEVFVCKKEIDSKPRPKSIVVLISYSGETRTILSWAEKFKEIDADITAISGFDDSTLAKDKEVNHKLIFGGDKRIKKPGSGIMGGSGKINQFYEQAAYILSPMPIYLCSKLEKERGYEITEKMLRAQHSLIA